MNLSKISISLVVVIGSAVAATPVVVISTSRALRTEERAISNERRVDVIQATVEDVQHRQDLRDQKIDMLLENLSKSNRRIERKLHIEEE